MFNNIRHICFLGIGGIGMSALARYFHARGMQVCGYDRTESAITRALIREGMQVLYTDAPSLLPSGIDLVIYTPAIGQTNRCLQQLSSTSLPVMKRAEVLGLISRQQPTIAVAGTHGKTTISCMLAHVMRQAGIRTEAILGGISANDNTNYLRADDAAWLVTEADEYDRSFLHLHPVMAAITAIDTDHLDIYGTNDALLESFAAFSKNISQHGHLLIKEGTPHQEYAGTTLTYHMNKHADYRAKNFFIQAGECYLSVTGKLELPSTKLGLPGKHNAENALAAAALAHLAGVNTKAISEGLSSFKGVKRRFEVCFQNDHMVYIDDYAHHPAEIQACIEAARELFPDKQITGIFQPHLYSRTRDLAEGFASSLALLDNLIMLDIYPAREEPIDGITAQWLLDQVPMTQKKLRPKESVDDEVAQLHPGVLITMGAGNIDTLVNAIVEQLETRYKC